MPEITVVGGGVTGLAAAYFLQKSAPDIHVSLVEASLRFGGKVLTNSIGGAAAEGGPDSLVARNSIITDLCRELGLEQDIIAPKSSRSYLWARKKLRPIPEGVFSGYPSRGLLPLWRSRVLTLKGFLRVAMDILLPRTAVGEDVAIGYLTMSRFGKEFKETLVDPLIGGLMSCSSDYLSARELMPGLFSIAKNRRSVILAAPRQERKGQSAPFFSFKKGIGELTEKLDDATENVDKHMGEEAVEIARRRDRWLTRCRNADIESDAVISALPAYAAAPVLKGIPELSALLSKISHTSVANVVLAYRAEDFNPHLEGSGFLVPEKEGLMMTGCSWLSSKWSNAEADGLYLVRCFVGTPDNLRWKGLSDQELASEMHAELSQIVDISGRPVESIVTRWENALPRYGVGHMELVSRAMSLCPPGLFLAGSSYAGVGISSCVADARKAAESAASYSAGVS